nr:hypothetical protein CFP56_79596 [Quercus suber]
MSQAQQSSCLPRTRSASFSGASIPLPVCLVTSGVSASSAQPSHSLHLAAISTRASSVHLSDCLHPCLCSARASSACTSTIARASSVHPSHCLRLAAFNTGIPSASPSRCLHLAAFNLGVPAAHPLTALILRPSIWEFQQHTLLLPSSCDLQRTLGTPTPSLAVAYGHDACIF